VHALTKNESETKHDMAYTYWQCTTCGGLPLAACHFCVCSYTDRILDSPPNGTLASVIQNLHSNCFTNIAFSRGWEYM